MSVVSSNPLPPPPLQIDKLDPNGLPQYFSKHSKANSALITDFFQLKVYVETTDDW